MGNKNIVLTTDTLNIVMLYLPSVDIETGSTTTSPYCLGSWISLGQYGSHFTCKSNKADKNLNIISFHTYAIYRDFKGY